MGELADLAFIVDEVILEPDGPRGQACAKQLYQHVHRGAELDQYAERLLHGSYADYVTGRNVGWALACWAYRHDDGALVRRLLEGPFRAATLQLDHRRRVGPAVIGALAEHAERCAGADRSLVFTALLRLGGHGADLGPTVTVALVSLGTPPAGRGHARFDLGAQAVGLVRAAAKAEGMRARIVAELERLGAGKGKPAAAARELLAELMSA